MIKPQSLPRCEHGRVSDCLSCGEQKRQIEELLQPLADEFWDNRGDRSIEHLLYRAYKLGCLSCDEAKTAREQELEDVLRTARCIAERCGEDTDWEVFSNCIARLGIGSVTARVCKLPRTDQ